MLKKIAIEITTEQYEVPGSFYGAVGELPTPALDAAPASPDDVQLNVFIADASYHDDGHRVCIRYTENAESGMEGVKTTLSYQKTDPGRITLLRDGEVKTALEFVQGERYFGVYQTPIMPFDLCLLPRTVDNSIETTGFLQLDYVIQLKGAEAQRTKLTLWLL